MKLGKIMRCTTRCSNQVIPALSFSAREAYQEVRKYRKSVILVSPVEARTHTHVHRPQRSQVIPTPVQRVQGGLRAIERADIHVCPVRTQGATMRAKSVSK